MSSSSINDGEYYQPSQTAITAFLAKLWALVNDPSCDDIIAWDQSGGSFHVYDQARFAREILPRYFKHNNFASFIRQLNMYGFRKMSSIEHNSLKNERDDIEFAHPSFIRGHDTLLELIKRRAPDNHQQQKTNVTTIKTDLSTTSASTTSPSMVSTNCVDTKPVRSFEYTNLLDDVRTLQSKQTSLTDKLFHMQDENQALWREVGMLKQKHSKQQQIVSKLMEFLLHFLSNPNQTLRPSVEQAPTNQSQQQQQQQQQQNSSQHHTLINPQISTNSLKRKPAAIMLGEESRKRTTIQQQHLLSQPINIGRQQGIIINELTDNDTTGWLHTTDTSPLVDLVPSPPPPPSTGTSINSNLDDTYQKQTNNFEWSVPTDEIRNTLNFSPQSKTITNENNTDLTDFFLNTDNNHGTKTGIGQIDDGNLTGINTPLTNPVPLLKAEQIDFTNTFQRQQPIKQPILNPTISFTLDDVTGDVHHIQSSLDNIRELMFDNLPEGTTIEDLFCDDHALLSPLLTSTTNNTNNNHHHSNNPTTNILTDNTEQLKTTNHFIYSNSNDQCKQLMLHKSQLPIIKNSTIDVDNQLLEQLINETVKVEEQRQTINQLEREKINLEGKIHRLEQEQQKK